MNRKNIYNNFWIRSLISLPFFFAAVKVAFTFFVDISNSVKNVDGNAANRLSSQLLVMLLVWILPQIYIGFGILKNQSRSWLMGVAYSLVIIPIFMTLFVRKGVNPLSLIAIILVYIFTLVASAAGYLNAKKSI